MRRLLIVVLGAALGCEPPRPTPAPSGRWSEPLYPRLALFTTTVPAGDTAAIARVSRWPLVSISLEDLRGRLMSWPEFDAALRRSGTAVLGYDAAWLLWRQEPAAPPEKIAVRKYALAESLGAVGGPLRQGEAQWFDVTQPGAAEALAEFHADLFVEVRAQGVNLVGLHLDFSQLTPPFDWELGPEWWARWRLSADAYWRHLRKLLPDEILIGNGQPVVHPAANGWFWERFPDLFGGSWFSNVYGPQGIVSVSELFHDPRLPWVFVGYDGTNKPADWSERVKFALAVACHGDALLSASHSHPDVATKPWDEWHPCFGTPGEPPWLGRALSGVYARGAGVFSRDFEHGRVDLIPSESRGRFYRRDGSEVP